MAAQREMQPGQNGPSIYHIRVNGHFDSGWTDWFAGMSISPEADGTTLLSGPIADQAALHGLLRKIRDLGLTLLSVDQAQSG